MNIDSLQRRAAEELAQGNFQQSHHFCEQILRADPRHPEAHFLLAINNLHRRQPAKSIVLLKVATGLSPDKGRYWVQLARAYSQTEQVAETEQALERALELKPDDALSIDTIGVVLSRLGDHLRAEPFFRKSLQRQPDNPDFLFNLATSERFNGKLEEAYEHFCALYRLQAQRYEIYPSIAELAPGNMLGKIQSGFEAKLARTTDVDARLQISHGLARILERQKQPVAALDILIEGNRQKRQSLPYSSTNDKQLYDSISQLCTAPFCGQGGATSSDRPIFIVGMPRSGTTLLERIVSSHSGVYSAGELQDFAIAFKQLSGSRTQALLDPDTIRAGEQISFDDLGQRYLNRTRSRSGHSAHYIDKMPLNFLYAGLIHKALPHARIICLRRNPMDTVLSNFRQLFALRFSQYNYAYDLMDTARYYLFFDKLMSHWQTVLPDEVFHQVHYEDLVEDTEAQIKSILEFLGLPWEEQCLEFHQNSAPVATASAVQVRQPIYRSSIARWKTVEAQLEPVKALFLEAGIAF
ncbi:MAG: sulfotransferase [Halioglobus sp.]